MFSRAESRSRSSQSTDASPADNPESGLDLSNLVAIEQPVSHPPTGCESNF